VKLLFASGNAGKVIEVREILAPLLPGHELVSLLELGLEPPEETGSTFQENAALKATCCAVQSKLWALADDSGICVDALGGAPGVYSARYAETDEARRAKLLGKLDGTPEQRRGAHFFCAVALASPDGKRIFRAEEQMLGRIALSARGSGGFGYDPIFEPTETAAPGAQAARLPRTVAELPAAEKNRLSHRGRALQRLLPVLEKLLREGDL